MQVPDFILKYTNQARWNYSIIQKLTQSLSESNLLLFEPNVVVGRFIAS